MKSDDTTTEEPSDLLRAEQWPRPHSPEAPVDTRQSFAADLIGLDIVQVKYKPEMYWSSKGLYHKQSKMLLKSLMCINMLISLLGKYCHLNNHSFTTSTMVKLCEPCKLM